MYSINPAKEDAMEKSNVDKLKDALLYAPVGAFGFVKDNAPTFFNMFVSRGKRDVAKTTMSAEEKLFSTKEHGQIVAMGTPVMRSKADQIASEAKNKGEEIAHLSIDVALGALGFLDNAVKSVVNNVSTTSEGNSKLTTVQTPHPSSVKAAASQPESVPTSVEVETEQPSFVPSSFESGEGDFVAEPVAVDLPEKIKGEYEKLSAPEIIDLLDDFAEDDLASIREYEEDFRNRQTIIHAINYRLDQKL